MTFSNEQLQEYLAGTLPQDEAAALEEQLSQDAALEARLFALDFGQAAALRDAFDAVPAGGRLDALSDNVTNGTAKELPTSGLAGWKIASAAAVAAFALGALVFAGSSEIAAPNWHEQVAIYQTLYVQDTLSEITPNDAALTAQLSRSADALDRPLPLPVLRNVGGLDLLRAQILGFKDAPLIQMAYLTDDGVPVALCAIRLAGDDTDGLRFETIAGMPVVHWSDGNFSYMIVGHISEDRLRDMAKDVIDVL